MLFEGVLADWLYDEQYISFLRAGIMDARKSVFVQQFVVDVRPDEDVHGEVRYLLHALAQAAHRGLDVRVLLPVVLSEGPMCVNMNESAIHFLGARGVPIRTVSKTVRSHVKAVLIDERLLILGSHNWTPSAFRINSESSMVITSQECAKQFANCFFSLWQQAAAATC